MARTTLAQLRNELRGLTEAGTADYTLGTISFWDDDQMDTVLDRHREDFIFESLIPYPVQVAGGSTDYFEYRTERRNFEQTSGGTTVFYIQDASGSVVGTANYSADYLRGIVTFTADTSGSSRYFTGRSYDLNAAAGDIWRKKAAHYFSAFSFATDNHRVDRQQIYDHCVQMAESFEAMSQDSVMTIDMWRSDTDAL